MSLPEKSGKEKDIQVPDVVGFIYEEAYSILYEAGFTIHVCLTGEISQFRKRVLRQRLIGNNNIELIICYESYNDPGVK